MAFLGHRNSSPKSMLRVDKALSVSRSSNHISSSNNNNNTSNGNGVPAANASAAPAMRPKSSSASPSAGRRYTTGSANSNNANRDECGGNHGRLRLQFPVPAKICCWNRRKQ
eukprot:Gb_23027 [translate_table: standard]